MREELHPEIHPTRPHEPPQRGEAVPLLLLRRTLRPQAGHPQASEGAARQNHGRERAGGQRGRDQRGGALRRGYGGRVGGWGEEGGTWRAPGARGGGLDAGGGGGGGPVGLAVLWGRWGVRLEWGRLGLVGGGVI